MNQTALPGETGEEGRKLGRPSAPHPTAASLPNFTSAVSTATEPSCCPRTQRIQHLHLPHTELGAHTARTDRPLFLTRLCTDEKKGREEARPGHPCRVLSAASVGRGNTLRPQTRSDVTPSKAQAGEETALRAKTRRGHGQEAQREPGQRRGGNGMEEESQGVCRPPPTPTTALPATRPAAGGPARSRRGRPWPS